jgi:hypothetical protein
MKRAQFITLVCLVGLLIISVPVVSSQGEDTACPELATLAIDSTEASCEGTGRNQICYGHILVEAQPQTEAESFVFADMGDIVDLLNVRSLILAPMDEAAQEWGISLMRLQANLPSGATGPYATLVAFGNIQLDNAAEELPTLEVTANTYANVRRRPSVDDFVLASLAPAQTLMADGKLEDGSWLRVIVPETQETGWISTSLVRADESLDTLTVVTADSTRYNPFQAFYLQTGISDAPCAAAPESGILIQTPEGVAEVRLMINEIAIQLGSTAFIQSRPGEDFAFNLLEGSSQVEAGGVTQRVYPGTRVRVPLDANGHAAGTPTIPEPYDPAVMAPLPLRLLPYQFEIVPPLTWPEIYALLGQTEEGGEEPIIVGEGSGLVITHASFSPGNRQVNLQATYNGGIVPGVTLVASPGGVMGNLGDHYQLLFTVPSDWSGNVTVTASTGESVGVSVAQPASAASSHEGPDLPDQAQGGGRPPSPPGQSK